MKVLTLQKLKDQILSNFDQVILFSKYTGIETTDITTCLANSNKKTNNPLRNDTHASVGFKWILDKKSHEHKIRMHDFGDSYWRGDIFDIAGKVMQLNSNNNLDFVKICEMIIDGISNTSTVHHTNTIKVPKCNSLTEFSIEFREYNNHDRKYWRNSGLDEADLVAGKVYAVQSYCKTEDDIILYIHKNGDPCYAYMLDVINGITIWKLYFPNRGRGEDKRARFITNNTYPLEALHELTDASVLVITKARVEKLLLNKLLNTSCSANLSFLLGNNKCCVTNFTTETARLSKPLVTALRSKYKYIYLNTDFDAEGIRCARYHLDNYGLPTLFLTNGSGGTKNYGAKDIRDYYVRFGKNKTVQLLNDIINKIVEDLEEIDRKLLT